MKNSDCLCILNSKFRFYSLKSSHFRFISIPNFLNLFKTLLVFWFFCSHQKQWFEGRNFILRQCKHHCMTDRIFWWKLSDFRFRGYFVKRGSCCSFISARIFCFVFLCSSSANRENISTRYFTKLSGWCLNKHSMSEFILHVYSCHGKQKCMFGWKFFCLKVNYAPLFHLWYPALFFSAWFYFIFFFFFSCY